MIVLLGESGVGKTVIKNFLIQEFKYEPMISCTTRPPRKNEVGGKDYFFITKEKFFSLIKKDKFIEYALYKNEFYGTLKEQIKDNGITIMEPIGFHKLLNTNLKDSVVSFYITAPEETRLKRLHNRGDKEIDIIKKKISDKKVFTDNFFQEVDFCVNSKYFSVENIAEYINNAYKWKQKFDSLRY